MALGIIVARAIPLVTVLAAAAMTAGAVPQVPGADSGPAGATLTVATSHSPARPGGAASGSAGAKPTRFCPAQPTGGLTLNPRFRPPKPPPGATIAHPPPSPACAYITGFSDVRKLHCAALVGPGLINLSLNTRTVIRHQAPSYFEFDTAGQLDYQPKPGAPVIHGLPPFTLTCIAFGFMPVTATIELLERGTTNIYSIGTGSLLTTNLVYTELTLRILKVLVNGVDLPVGPHCQGGSPFRMKLTGNPRGIPPYALAPGGPLSGVLTLPKFTGCGVGENLDPIFDGTVSGPLKIGKFISGGPNFTLLTQGPLCTPQSHFGCPPGKPVPVRSLKPSPPAGHGPDRARG